MSHLVVKQRSFWHTPQGIATVVLLGLLLAWGIFEFGRYRAGYNALEAANATTALQEQILGLEKLQNGLREQNAVLERSAQIERQAYKQLEGAVTGLQDEILELKEELAFYRGIISPKDASKGLRMQDFEISPGLQARQYHFKVVLTQVLNNGRLARGTLGFEVTGLLGGEAKTFTLEQMSEGTSTKGPSFSFKYFQILEGDFMLPEGFEPIKVDLTVTPRTSAHKKQTQVFDWAVKERS